MRLITDSLQSLLITYHNQLELAHNHGGLIEESPEMQEFWNKNLIVHTIVKNGDHGWYNDLFGNDDDSSFKMDISKALSNPEFENIVVNRLMLLYSAHKRLSRVQSHIQQIEAFIQDNYDL